MLTFDQAATLGYTFDSDPEDDSACIISKGGAFAARVHSECPRFFALRLVADFEGDDLATAEVTAALVQQTSGETYDPIEPPPVIATSNDADAAAAQIVTDNLAAANINTDTLPAIFGTLLGQAKAAIPYYEGYTLQPDPATALTNFQALPQATKDRILYNCCRSLAAIMRYLSGDLPTA